MSYLIRKSLQCDVTPEERSTLVLAGQKGVEKEKTNERQLGDGKIILIKESVKTFLINCFYSFQV